MPNLRIGSFTANGTQKFDLSPYDITDATLYVARLTGSTTVVGISTTPASADNAKTWLTKSGVALTGLANETVGDLMNTDQISVVASSFDSGSITVWILNAKGTGRDDSETNRDIVLPDVS